MKAFSAPFCCLILALNAPLPAQTAVLRVLLARDALEAATPAQLLVLEGGVERPLSRGLEALLQQEDLRVLQVPLRTVPADHEEGRRLAARLRLPGGTRWLLLGPGEAVLAQGTALPTPATLLQALRSAGFRDRVQELRAFLRNHPGSLEAQERLIDLLRQRGEAAAQHAMDLEVAGPETALAEGDLAGYLRTSDAPPQADLLKARPLSPLQDLEAWGAFAQALDQAFRSGAWRELDLAFTRNGRPLDAASPTLQALYQRMQPDVEAALQQDPGSEPLWDLWIWLARARGGGGLRALLAILAPSPLHSRADWPPERATRLLLATARTPQDWRSLLDHFQDRWDGTPSPLRTRVAPNPALPAGAQATATALLERAWTGLLAPLLECSLRCGDVGRADALLRETVDATHWTALSAKASEVARRCGQPALAVRWAALRPGGLP